MKRSDYDNVDKVRFEMKLTMKNAEGGYRKRKFQTIPIDVRLKSEAYRNEFFKIIDEEWTGVYRRFTSENFLKHIDEDVFEPRSEDESRILQRGKLLGTTVIFILLAVCQLEIQFPFIKNIATHIAQVTERTYRNIH